MKLIFYIKFCFCFGKQMSTAVPHGKHQPVSGRDSTLMGGHLGIPCVVDYNFKEYLTFSWNQEFYFLYYKLLMKLIFYIKFCLFWQTDVYSHTTLKAPVLVWSLKLSSVGQG